MNIQELLWKYAEGECSPDEMKEVESLVGSDANLRIELEAIQEAQSLLLSMEPEQPSMRFVQNVMEALPKLYSAISAEPLIKPVWKKIFWGSLVGITAIIILFFPAASPSPGEDLPFLTAIFNGIGSTLEQIPPAMMQYFLYVLAAFAVLVLVDKAMAGNALRRLFKQ